MNSKDQESLKAMERRLKVILPEDYQDRYEDLEPVSMGSAALKYGRDGKVAWDDIWESFCDLAMAGGPPHRGGLLQPGTQMEIEAQSDSYRDVIAEICRGMILAADLSAKPSPTPGWVRVRCESSAMADWLVRAILMENVSARSEGFMLDLPAGPGYRIEKEIKNVITVIAKTCHYWIDHMGRTQQRQIEDLFAAMALESPLIAPSYSNRDSWLVSQNELAGEMAADVHRTIGLHSSNQQYVNWLGVRCPDVRASVWMMRAMVVSNVLARREGTVLFAPINPAIDAGGKNVVQALIRVFGFARARKVL